VENLGAIQHASPFYEADSVVKFTNAREWARDRAAGEVAVVKTWGPVGPTPTKQGMRCLQGWEREIDSEQTCAG
jgi:hypothetical protein